jgi:hypothetical protein
VNRTLRRWAVIDDRTNMVISRHFTQGGAMAVALSEDQLDHARAGGRPPTPRHRRAVRNAPRRHP